MKRLYLWLISMLSGVLLALAWPAHGFTPLVFVALFPLFWVEDYILERQQEYDRHQAARKALRISPKLKAYIDHILQKLPVSKKTDGNKILPVLNGVPRYNRISGDAPESTLPKRTRYHLFFYSFSAFLVWNVLTTWWIWNSTPAAVLAFVLNALLMALVFTLFHYSCRYFFKKGMRWILLFIYWLGFEYFHHNWDVSWPWLTLGNAFAPRPQWVQWYEITGTLGGSLWILGCNVALLYWYKAWRAQKRGMPIHSENRLCLSLRGKLLLFCGLVIVPAGLSMLRFATYQEKGRPVEVVAVQPNIDPYVEQYTLSPRQATERMLRLAQSQMTPQTRFIVTPESMIQENIWENQLPYSPSVKQIQDFLQEWPNAQLIAGISSYSHVRPEDSTMQGVRRLRRAPAPEKRFYRAHNTIIALSANPDMPIPMHHKCKLVPGVEIMPYINRLKFLENLAIDLGGTVGTLGIDPGPTVFVSESPDRCRVIGGSYAGSYYSEPSKDAPLAGKTSQDEEFRFADLICYESVYGDYVASCVREGAELLFVSTNDGWWKDTPGHRQHASYARLRAIENRRDVARAANTGISCFIDQKGRVYQATSYWEPACIRQTLYANDKLSIYAQYGDILGRCCLPLSLFFILLTFVSRIIKRR